MSKENTHLTHTGLEIAVIGMAGRFPGASGIHAFWNNLKNGVESITFYSPAELEETGIEEALIRHPDYVKANLVLEEKEYFDSSFFGYLPGESRIMDPQMRIFHECVWHALEDAGYDPGTYKGFIGLYAGASSNFSWEAFARLSGQNTDVDSFTASHLRDSREFLTTFISYKLKLNGSAVSLQTACSTSLVAIHLACRSLLTGENTIALAGGVCVTRKGREGYLYLEGMISSPDGHCRAFDAGAQGTVFGEGAAVVVLKRLKNAIADRDHIWAVVKGSAINNDGGRKVGFTTPAAHGQAEVIRLALKMARVEPDSIHYIETHGTGTPLGDPIEIEALNLVFGGRKDKDCAIGSVKTNVGHLDAAAGAAGFIKTVLALKHKLIPPSLHFQQPNPDIDFAAGPFYVNTGAKEWKSHKFPRRAGVSSFGIGGTNAHVVLEEWPGTGELVEAVGRSYQLILLSAKTRPALERMTRNLAGYFKKNPGINPADAAYTLKVGRAVFNYKRIWVGRDLQEAARDLAAPQPNRDKTYKANNENKTIVFLFPGQGAQYVNMGRQIYETQPIFRAEMDRCFEILKPLMESDIKEILYPSSVTSVSSVAKNEDINQTEIAQPVIFCIQYALAKLLMHWGIEPRVMMGHSIGEYTAACVSGVFSLQDALGLVVLRGRLMQRMPPGAMLSVPLSEEEIQPYLDADPGLSLAAVNAPGLCVVSGGYDAIDNIRETLTAAGINCRRLHTSHAYHSSMMDPVLPEFAGAFSKVTYQKPGIVYISNLTGRPAHEDEISDPGYWTRHLRETIRFSDGVTLLLENKNVVFIEVGPGNTLCSFINRHPAKSIFHQTVNLVRHPQERHHDVKYLLEKLGELWLYGIVPDWERYYRDEPRQRVSLPGYSFEKTPYPVGGDILKLLPAKLPFSPQVSPLVKNPDISCWFYVPSWKKSVLFPVRKENQPMGCILVFMDASGVGSGLLEKFSRHSHTVVTVTPGQNYSQQSELSYKIDPGCEDHYETLFQQLKEGKQIPTRILHLWGISGHQRELTKEAVNHTQQLGFYSLLHIARAIGNQLPREEIEIKVITNNMQEVRDIDECHPGKNTILAAVEVIPQEYKNVSCQSIDILLPEAESIPAQDLWLRIYNELNHSTADVVIAYRGLTRWVRTLEPVTIPQAPGPSPFKYNGVYLITGGLGGMGLVFAQYLAENFKARLILTGRSNFPAKNQWEEWLRHHGPHDKTSKKISKLKAMEKAGAEVLYLQVDVSRQREMEEKLKEAESYFGRLNGIIHTAGTADYAGVIHQRKKSKNQEIFTAKIDGTLVLEEITRGRSLEVFVLCSSVNSVFCPFGQVGYAAANGFLDAYARYKAKRGDTAVISVGWSAWQEVGMAVEAAKRSRSQSTLQQAITPAEGIEVLARLVTCRLPHVLVSPLDLNIAARYFQRKTGEVEDKGKEKTLVPSTIHGERPEFITPYLEPSTPTEKALAGMWQEFFGIKGIGINDDFFQLGGDSLKAMTILDKIHERFNIKISLPEFFAGPTIKALAFHIDSAEKGEFAFIDKAEEREYYPLSSAQERLYLLQQMAPDNVHYNLPQPIPLMMEIDRERLEEALQKLIARHESLRTSFHLIAGQPVQKIHHEVQFEVEYYDSGRQANYDSGRQGEREIGNLLKDSGRQGNRQIGNEEDMSNIDSQSSESSQKKPASLSPCLPESFKNFVRPFDLSQAPLLRVGFVSVETRNHLLLIDIHHIITDGISQEILTDQFMKLYGGTELAPLKLQYRDYAVWQRSGTHQSALKPQEEYWLKELSSELPILALPTDYSRPAIRSFEGARSAFPLEENEITVLRDFCRKYEVTLYMVLLSVFYILLARLSGEADIIVGTPTAGRRHVDLMNIIGMFVNTLAIRVCPAGEITFADFLQQVKTKTLAAFENQEYQFEDIVEKVVTRRNLSRNPIFDVFFALLNQGESPGEAAVHTGKIMSKLEVDLGHVAKFDLMLTGITVGNQLFLVFEYCTRLFKEETVQRMVDYFKKILTSVLRAPDIQLLEIDILPETEKQQLLIDFNSTHSDYPRDRTVHELFEEQAAQNPDSVALVEIHETHEKHKKNYDMSSMSHLSYISYSELNKKSQCLANVLREKGVTPGTIVAIMMQRSIEMMVSLLAVLKAGAAYLPVEPGYPQERINYMLADSKARILLKSETRIPGGAPIQKFETNPNDLNSNDQNERTGITVLNFEHLNFEICLKQRDFEFRASNLKPSNLCYIIYTSGSTGRPKGVMVEHGNVVRLVKHTNFIDCSPGDRLLLTGGIGFDITTFEIWWPLLNGLSLFLAAEAVILDAALLAEIVQKNNVTVLHLVPQLFNQLVVQTLDIFSGLKYFLIGGDLVRPKYLTRLRRVYKELKILHMYGPTENTTFSTFFPVEDDYDDKIPLGKPIANSTVYILDQYARSQPVGVAGELCTGGDGIACGYLNNPELTAEKFLATDEHGRTRTTSYQKKLYKTGDLARWLPGGNIEFLGRIDNQVKIRGMRIEPGEVENQLLTHHKIKEAVVLAKQDKNGDTYLCAYIVSPGNEEPRKELKEYLLKTLPDYMIPSYFVPVEKIPLTPTGKLDRKALPEPGAYHPDLKKTYIAPQSELEKEIALVWQEVLQLDRVGTGDNFFDLGGNSLKVIQLKSELEKVLDREVPVVILFEHTTITSFVRYLGKPGAKKAESHQEMQFHRQEEIHKGKHSRVMLRDKRRRDNPGA